jgi:hypothetical protein
MIKKRITKTKLLDWLEDNNYYELPVDQQMLLEKIFTASSPRMMLRFSMILLKWNGAAK